MSFDGGQPVKKNAEFLLVFPIYDSGGDLVTGAADLDSEISKDGGDFIDCTNEAVEIGSSGIYKLTLTAEEMNADVVAVITKTTTENAKTTPTVIYTSDYQVVAMRGTDGAITSLTPITDDKDSYKADVSNLDVAVSSRSSHSAANVWAVTTRTLSSFGSLVQDIWDKLTSALTTVGSIGKLLVTNIDSKISSRATLGVGAITWTYTLTDADTGLPIADADVWVTSDEAGANVRASGRTNQDGKITFYLDAGTIYVWRQKTGYNFINPDEEVVS